MNFKMKNDEKTGLKCLRRRSYVEARNEKTDGGFIDFLYEYVTGRSLAKDLRALTIELGTKHAEIVASNPIAFIQ